jgi:hypothetical protein
MVKSEFSVLSFTLVVGFEGLIQGPALRWGMGILGYWETGVEGREGGHTHGESLGRRVSGVGGMESTLAGWWGFPWVVWSCLPRWVDGLMG